MQRIRGENDPRCSTGDSPDARDKLVEPGNDVELFLYEEDGHSFLKIENVIDSELRHLAFLRRVMEKQTFRQPRRLLTCPPTPLRFGDTAQWGTVRVSSRRTLLAMT